MENIKDIITQPEYEFLGRRTVLFLTFGGSYAYGTNKEGSDIDICGVVAQTPQELLGFSKFDQYVDQETDTTLFGFNKFIGLLMDCNPIPMEMLGCRPEDYAMVSEGGQLLLDNKNLFLSRKAMATFCAYAQNQLRRIQVQFFDRDVSESEKADFAMTTFENIACFREDINHIPHGLFGLKIAGTRDNGEALVNLVLQDNTAKFREEGLPLNEVRMYLDGIATMVKSYNKTGRRNRRAMNKSMEQLNKHAMHLVRMYLTGLDMLENGVFKTYRSDDRDLLMQIRSGAYMKDGKLTSEFFSLVDSLDARLEYARENTMLPDSVDTNKIEELAIEINRMSVNAR